MAWMKIEHNLQKQKYTLHMPQKMLPDVNMKYWVDKQWDVCNIRTIFQSPIFAAWTKTD